MIKGYYFLKNKANNNLVPPYNLDDIHKRKIPKKDILNSKQLIIEGDLNSKCIVKETFTKK